MTYRIQFVNCAVPFPCPTCEGIADPGGRYAVHIHGQELCDACAPVLAPDLHQACLDHDRACGDAQWWGWPDHLAPADQTSVTADELRRHANWLRDDAGAPLEQSNVVDLDAVRAERQGMAW